MSAQETTNEGTLAFVDEIDGDTARLLIGEETFTLPTAALPADAREGSWLRLYAKVVPAPPSNAEAIRRKLARDDPGGNIKL